MRPRPSALDEYPAGYNGLRRYQFFQRSFPLTEAAVPATALRDSAVARWARQRSIAVDVRTSEELGIVVAHGIKPTRIVVHADTLCDRELHCAVSLGVGRVIVGTVDQIEFLAACPARARGVLVRMTDPGAPGTSPLFGFPFESDEANTAIGTVLAHDGLTLAGLHVRVGPDEHACISCPAAVGNMIAEMEHVRRQHAIVLTRVGLDCEFWTGDWGMQLSAVAEAVDDAIGDACEAMRFPRPHVLLSTGAATLRSVVA